jgi:hypothetical protein
MYMIMKNDQWWRRKKKKKARKKTGFSEGNKFIRKEIDSARNKNSWGQCKVRLCESNSRPCTLDLGAWSFMVSVFEGCLYLCSVSTLQQLKMGDWMESSAMLKSHGVLGTENGESDRIIHSPNGDSKPYPDLPWLTWSNKLITYDIRIVRLLRCPLLSWLDGPADIDDLTVVDLCFLAVALW